MRVSAALVALSASLAAAVPSLTVDGDAFINPSTGKKLQIVGVAYQNGGEAGYKPQDGVDPLSNPEICKRDAALLQAIGVNLIRSYNLSPNLNHDECASVFNAAGIYMIIDVNSPLSGESINRAAPWTTYDSSYLNRTFAIVEAFKNYPNTLAFFSANEVINEASTANTVPPYLRAVQRDLKQYIAKHSTRHIPVGYSAADVRPVLADTFNYLTCNNGDDSAAELFALNSYSWCGPDATFESSTYAQLVPILNTSPVPVFFSEYGCNKPEPRYFNEVQAIYGPNMTSWFSGGIVYDFSQEADNYGLVTVGSDGSITELNDYNALMQQYAKVDWASVQWQSPPATAVSAPKCSASLITEPQFDANFTLPAQPPGVADMIANGISPAPVGKIISVTDFSFTYPIKDPSGNSVTGLEVKPLSDTETNVPGNSTSNNGTNSHKNAGTGSSHPMIWDLVLPIVLGLALFT